MEILLQLIGIFVVATATGLIGGFMLGGVFEGRRSWWIAGSIFVAGVLYLCISLYVIAS